MWRHQARLVHVLLALPYLALVGYIVFDVAIRGGSIIYGLTSVAILVTTGALLVNRKNR